MNGGRLKLAVFLKVEPDYKDIAVCDPSYIASDILLYQLILLC
jgi:hypothetical protein